MRFFLTPLLGLIAAFALAVAAAPGARAQDGYRLNTGDVLSIEVLEDNSLNREVLVLPDGSFSFPFAGTVRAQGLTTQQIATAITRAIAPNFANTPNVFVTVRQLRPPSLAVPAAPATIDVYFLGEVARPGLVQLAPGTTLLQALAQGGAFTNFAATKRIQLRRTDQSGRQSVTTINYRAISRGAALSRDIVLADGDIILVPERGLFE